MNTRLSVICLCLLLLGQVFPASAKNDVRDKWAVVIGINRFQDSTIGGMPFAVKNALDTSKSFKDPRIGRFAADHVMTVLGSHATKSYIETEVLRRWLAKKALPDDMVVFYFCTRALPAKSPKDIVLCSFDTLSSEAEQSGIDFADLIKSTQKLLACHNIVSILDLQAAEGKREESLEWNAQDLAQECGQAVLSASSRLQNLKPTASNNSVFSYFLVQVLSGGSGMLPLSAVADYMDRNIENAAGSSRAKQASSFAFARGKGFLADDVLGVEIKYRRKNDFAFGHPLSELAYDHPESMPGSFSRTATLAQAAPKKHEPTGDDDDDQGAANIDYGPYVTKMKQDIQKQWQMPKGMENQKAVCVFSIKRDGTIVSPQIVQTSGSAEVDRSCLESLSKASPLSPLPKGAPQSIDMRYTFKMQFTNTSTK